MSYLTEIGIQAQRVLPHFVMTHFTKNFCEKMGKRRDLEAKLKFAKEYNIDWTTSRLCQDIDTLEQCVAKFPTLNHFFTRKIIPSLTQPETTASNAIVSPAECHARRVSSTDTFEIKGAQYNLGTLLKLDSSKIPRSASIFIFRLAPDQYHRIHSPVVTKIRKIYSTGGEYNSVNPILLDRRPVLQTNYRKIMELANGMYFVCVGATCVGSVKLSVKAGDKIKHGQDIGAFEFGGSCLVLVVPDPLKINKFNTKITDNETIIGVGTWIADFTSNSKRNTRKIKRHTQ